MEEMTLIDFLTRIAYAGADEGIELIEKFQSGSLRIDGLSIGDIH